MKITIYELLGLMKDNKLPKEIKYNDNTYHYSCSKEDYERVLSGNENGLLSDLFRNDYAPRFLNHTVEITESPKENNKMKFEEIQKLNPEPISRRQYLCDEITIDFLKADIISIISKVNELVDIINKFDGVD